MAEEIIDKVAWIFVNGNGEVLLTRNKDKQVFYVPGGRREEAESDAEVLVRELKEELDIEFNIETMEFVGKYSAEAHDKPGVMVVTTCYKGEYSGTLKPSTEIDELNWFKKDEIDSERISPVSRMILAELRKKGIV